MIDIVLEAFDNQTFNQDGKDSAILKITFLNLQGLIFHHLGVKEKVKETDKNWIMNGYIIDTLTSNGIQEFIRIGAKVFKIYEDVIYTGINKIKNFRLEKI